jgi:hypothetical protein
MSQKGNTVADPPTLLTCEAGIINLNADAPGEGGTPNVCPQTYLT